MTLWNPNSRNPQTLLEPLPSYQTSIHHLYKPLEVPVRPPQPLKPAAQLRDIFRNLQLELMLPVRIATHPIPAHGLGFKACQQSNDTKKASTASMVN